MVKEACRRNVGKEIVVTGQKMTWDMVPYDVQLIGGIALHQGKATEMATGEGKTLVATMPLYLNALAGRGAHLVTVNTYLAQRDAEWMGVIYEFLGLTVDVIDLHDPGTAERRAAYNADITYGTNNEFGFDYLRDNMVHTLEQRVQRRAPLRHHRRGGLHPHRRSPDAPHHLRGRGKGHVHALQAVHSHGVRTSTGSRPGSPTSWCPRPRRSWRVTRRATTTRPARSSWR